MADVQANQRRKSLTLSTAASPRNSEAFRMIAPSAVGRMSSAAGKRLSDRTRQDGKAITRENWQADAYAYLRTIGELGYVTNMKADMTGHGDLRVREWDPDTGKELTAKDTKDADKLKTVHRVLRNMRGPTGDYHDILSKGALHDQVAGEGHLFCLPIGDTGQYAIEFLSVMEAKEDSSGVVTRVNRPKDAAKKSGSEVVVDKDAFVARYLREDPEHSDLPTSPTQRVLPICEEIFGLTQMIGTLINSRLPAGALFVPNDLDVDGGIVPDDDDDEQDLATPADVIAEHMMAPIEDRTSPASYVPLVIEGPPESGQFIKLIELAKPLDLWPMELRERAIVRLGTGLDIPPEVLAGKGGLNHWTGYNVDRDFVVKHVVPVGDRLARFLTVGYLRKMLVHFEEWSEEEANRFDLAYDPARLLANEDESGNAATLANLGLIGDDATIRAHGFNPETDGVSEANRRDSVLLNLIKANPAVAAQLGVFRLMGIPIGADPDAPDLAPAAPTNTALPEAPTQPSPTAGMKEPTLHAIGGRLHGFADAALDRALEKAGARIVTAAARNPEMRERARSFSKVDVVSAFTPAELDRLGLKPAELIAGSWTSVAARCLAWTTDALIESGMDEQAAVAEARQRSHELSAALDDLATRAFLRPLPSYGGSRVSAHLITEVLR